MSNRSIAMLALIIAVPKSASAQAAHEYVAPPAPVYWVSDNPFHLYLLRDGEPVGDTVRGISVFREAWTSIADGYDVVRASVDVGLSNRANTDTMRVTRLGKVVTVNGQTDYNRGEWDAMLRLPTAPFQVGLEWTDTLRHPTAGPAGEGLYEVQRHYRVTRRIESPDSAGFEVASTGTIKFNMSMWMDSTAGQYRWFELTGPVEEWFVFDPASGQLHRRQWSMALAGIGGDHDGSQTDTVPAALDSRNSRYRIPEARATALMAALPGSDTSISIRGDGALLFGHTMGRESNRLFEGFRRADGTVGRAEVEIENSHPRRWTFTWVDLNEDPRTATFEFRDGSLVTGGESLSAPVPNWGVAEYGMLGTLVPSLQQLQDVQQLPFAIYRPTAEKWDVVRVTKRQMADFSLVMIQTEAGGQSAILVDAHGLLLFEEAAAADGTRISRVPSSEARQQEVQRAVATLQGGI